MNKAARETMPPKAAVYVELLRIRERVLMHFLDRTHDAGKAIDQAYDAMRFIEEGDANKTEISVEDAVITVEEIAALTQRDTTDAQRPVSLGEGADAATSAAIRVSEPSGSPYSEIGGDKESAPAAAGVEDLHSAAVATAAGCAPRSDLRANSSSTAGAGGQSGSPAKAEADDLVKVGGRRLPRAKVDRLKEMWASADFTVRQCADLIGVPVGSIYYLTGELGLPGKTKAPRGNGGTATPKPHPWRGNGAIKPARTSLEDAIDWFEEQDDGRPVMPVPGHKDSFQIGEDEDPAFVTRSGLIAEINALRRRKQLPPFQT